MPGALRKLFVELDIKVNKKQLDESVQGLNSFMRTLNRLKKTSTKTLERSLQRTDKELKDAEKSSRKLEDNLDDAAKSAKKLEKSAKGAKREFSSLGRIADGVISGIAFSLTQFGVSGLRSFIENTMESTNELARWAGRLQIGVRELESWTQLSSLFGADIDDVTDAFKELQLKARDALDGTQSYIDVFKLIGISTDDLRENINDLPRLMDLFTTRLNENTDEATRNFVADELMSDAGTRMIEVFRMGTTEITRQRQALLEQNQSTDLLVKANRDFSMQVARTGIWLGNLRNRILVHVLPVLSKMTEGFENVSKFLIEAYQKGNLLSATMVVLGVAFAKSAAAALVAWAPVVASFAFWTLGIIAIILLLEDLIVTIRGGDSAIKSFLEGMEAWEPLVEFLERIWRGVQRVGKAFEQMWRGVERVGGWIRDLDQWLSRLLVTIDQMIARTEPITQFWATFSGAGRTAEEVEGTGQLAEEVRSAATDAESIRDSAANFLETLGPFGGLPGFLGQHALRAMGAGQRGRRGERATRAASAARRAPLDEALDRRIARAQQIRATEQQAMFNLFGPDPTQQESRPGTGGDVRINQDNTATFNISGVQDPEEVGRIVDNRMNQRQNQANRSLQNALVPEAAR
jgi:hypothetical protein